MLTEAKNCTLLFLKVLRVPGYVLPNVSITHREGEHCNENPIYVFPITELRDLRPNYHIHLSVSYLYFPGWVHIFSCSRIGRPIMGIYKSLTTDTWMWKLGLRPRNSFSRNICFKFSLLCLCSEGLSECCLRAAGWWLALPSPQSPDPLTGAARLQLVHSPTWSTKPKSYFISKEESKFIVLFL